MNLALPVSVGAPMFRSLGLLLAGVCLAMRATAQGFLASCQDADGALLVAELGGQRDSELAVQGLLLLAYLGDGSTSRSGPRRQELKKVIQWCRLHQDEEGRFALRADPRWLLDHALVTYALCEEVRLSGRPQGTVASSALAAVDALVRQLGTTRPAPTTEVRLWSQLCAESLSASVARTPVGSVSMRDLLALSAVDSLRAALAALPQVEPKTSRERAAALLASALAGRFGWPEGELPPEFPEDLMVDPLLGFYLSAATYQRGGAGWQLLRTRMGVQVVKTQIGLHSSDQATADYHGTWAPNGLFGAEFGRLGTTAVGVLMLEIYYRYGKLFVQRGY